MIRTGIGYDVHQLVKGEKLVVGSVEIVSSIGSLGHSDGDALIHSICDALFPSEDVKWKDSESVYFLKDVISKIENKGFTINNIDATVILEKPKLGNYIPSIKKKLSGITNLNASQISIKATTTDKLGFIGRESGWAVLAIATITDNNE